MATRSLNVRGWLTEYNPEDYTRISQSDCKNGRKIKLDFGKAESTLLSGGAYYSVEVQNGSWVINLEGAGYDQKTSTKAPGDLMYNSSGIYVEKISPGVITSGVNSPQSGLQPIVTFGGPSSNIVTVRGVANVQYHGTVSMKF